MPLNLKNFGIFLKNFNDGKIAYDDILASLNNFQNCTAKVSDTGYGFVLEKLLNDEKGTINTAEKTYWIVAPFFSLSKTFHQYPVDRKSLFKDYSEFSYPNALEAAILTFLKNYIYPSNEMYGSKKFGTCQTGHTNFHCFDDSQVVHFGMSKEGKICIDPPFYRKAASCSASTTAIFRLYTQAS